MSTKIPLAWLPRIWLWANVATARHWLEKAIDEGDVDVVWLRADPRFSSLQNDPAFQQMVRSVFITGVVQDAKAR